ncbi:hypothetical protein Airi01_088400 [Actinoallomurus iriomotensis]|uniref:Uncharacterized protein n=1 Tax=Actinoallomurus iriomotensis TaxID=478107 RepID=A0A9W6VQ14_9ACTN|nr:hypothetical protein Airi01_088400 [Actinoallomurus iriomotensis]
MRFLLHRILVPSGDRAGTHSDMRVHPSPRHDRPVWPKPADEHLLAGADETDSSWLMASDVILSSQVDPHPHAIFDVFARFPGCLVAALTVNEPVTGETVSSCRWPKCRPSAATRPPDRKFIRAPKAPEPTSAWPQLREGVGAIIGTRYGNVAKLEPLFAGAWREEDLWRYTSAVHAWLAAGESFMALHHAALTVCSAGRGTERGVRVAMADPGQEWFPMWEVREAGA